MWNGENVQFENGNVCNMYIRAAQYIKIQNMGENFETIFSYKNTER